MQCTTQQSSTLSKEKRGPRNFQPRTFAELWQKRNEDVLSSTHVPPKCPEGHYKRRMNVSHEEEEEEKKKQKTQQTAWRRRRLFSARAVRSAAPESRRGVTRC